MSISTDNKSTKFPAGLSAIFTSPEFQQVNPTRFKGKLDGVKVGVVIATLNSSYNNYAINETDLVGAIKAKHDGKINEAYVVYARRVDGTRVYVDAVPAEDLHEKLKNVAPIVGRFGKFWALPGTTTGDDWM